MNNKATKYNYQPISKAILFLELVSNLLENSKQQLINMNLAKTRPHVLDDEMINRSIALYSQEIEDLIMYIDQCKEWKKEELTEVHSYQVNELEKLAKESIKIDDQILSVVNECKDFTIDKILEKDDFELGLEFLLGKIK